MILWWLAWLGVSCGFLYERGIEFLVRLWKFCPSHFCYSRGSILLIVRWPLLVLFASAFQTLSLYERGGMIIVKESVGFILIIFTIVFSIKI